MVPPLFEAFLPDITIGVFGADTHRSDPFAHFNMSNYAPCKAVKIIRGLSPRLLALGGGYNLYVAARTWTLLWAIMNKIAPEDTFLGVVGGMMYGPESELGSLEEDAPISSTGVAKENIQREVGRVVDHIKKTVFPLWNIPQENDGAFSMASFKLSTINQIIQGGAAMLFVLQGKYNPMMIKTVMSKENEVFSNPPEGIGRYAIVGERGGFINIVKTASAESLGVLLSHFVGLIQFDVMPVIDSAGGKAEKVVKETLGGGA